MKRRLVVWVLVSVCLGAVQALGDQPAPRDIWPQATAAIDAADVDGATKKTTELVEVGKSYSIKNFPLYAESAAALARQAAKRGNKATADWATKTADQLDPNSPAIAFSKAEAASEQQNWAKAIPTAFVGYANIWKKYRARVLSRSDSLIVITSALTLTAMIFAVALFVRYGRAMAHDFREMLGARMGGGAVTVLA